ncbi:DUF3303 domain-containing protein [Methanococcoides methylutens]|uniref:DUF3303 domain-containing protein n=1 Tax=Methanococcoides methylutens MM1 TaxID=1434104 RepID=A0A0E3X0X2_METMT|nr:DUF3303 family protein [Methanococcoides methylutens]AKB85615.1 hypothetical protein MCMEM_1562 [Methanococcoides methylutens MM1]
MLFIDIVSWEPKDQNEIMKRFENWEPPEGIEIIGQWIDLSNCRTVVVYDAEDAKAYAAATFPWRDICYFDSFPVMEASELMEFLSEKMK